MTDENAHRSLSRTTRLLNEQFFGSVADERAIAKALTDLSVRIVADKANASTASGQACIVTLALLLARTGISVELDVPDVELSAQHPPLTGTRLRSALVDIGDDLIPGVTIGRREGRGLTTFLVGDTPVDAATPALRVSGDDWSFEIGVADALPGWRWAASLPFGALAGAAGAAGEAIRLAVPVLADKLGVALSAGAHRLSVDAPLKVDLRDYYPAIDPRQIDLGTIDMISGGAITNAALYVLLLVPRLKADARVIESDRLDLSNLNRYMLGRHSHDKQAKSQILESYNTSHFKIGGVSARYEEDTRSQLGPLRKRVLVGVDHIPSRWLTQREAMGWVGVGSTQSVEVLVSAHDPGTPCAGCLHPREIRVDPEAPTISVVSFWAGLLLALELLCDAAGAKPTTPVIAFWPLNYGPSLMRLGLAPHADCPVGCVASRPSAA